MYIKDINCNIVSDIATSHQIFQKCQNFLIFCVGVLYFLKNLMGTCKNQVFQKEKQQQHEQ
jgi:hypothetical protein